MKFKKILIWNPQIELRLPIFKYSTTLIFIFSLTITSSAASARTSKCKVTVGSAPNFRCSDRAEKRREVLFY